MTILVTGASGFLGLNLLSRFIVSHPKARLVASDLTHPDLRTNTVEYRPLDVNDRGACLRLLQDLRPTHIVHAAAITPSTTEIDPTVNVDGTRYLTEAAIATGSVQRFLFMSSSGLYGSSNDQRPCDEDHPLHLVTPYTLYKRQAELHLIEHSQKLNIVIARVGPLYGSFERPRSSRPTTSLIFQLIEALQTSRVLKVSGTDTSRDWTHANDASTAIDALLFAPTLRHLVYNVSCGIATNARTILAYLIDRGLQVTWEQDITMADVILDPSHNRKPLIIDRLQADTGFSPRLHLPSSLTSLLRPAIR